MKKIVISSAVRTPMGAFQGAFSNLKASKLGAAAIKEAINRANVSEDNVDLVLMGNVLSAGMGQAPARQAAIYAGLDKRTPSVTLNKMCGSGLEAIIQAFRAIAVGDAEVVVAGGMESMTLSPYLLVGARSGLRLGDKNIIDSMVYDGLWDAYEDKHMGSCAELCASKYNFSRQDQDAFAIKSYKRAQKAAEAGIFAKEIVPVEVKGRKTTTTISEDEGPYKVDFDRLTSLRPAFERDGSITAANASTLNDGAAALVITSEEYAKANNMPILAEIKGYSGHAQEPEWFTTAPVAAMQKLFAKLSLEPNEVDLYEVNEAFAVVTMAAQKEFNIPDDALNIYGGAVALGHPIGASGARIMVTLLNALANEDKKLGMASICIGGGEALAMVVERNS